VLPVRPADEEEGDERDPGPDQEADREPSVSAKRHSLAIMNPGTEQREREHDGQQCLRPDECQHGYDYQREVEPDRALYHGPTTATSAEANASFIHPAP
jgi:hypothetical protein